MLGGCRIGRVRMKDGGADVRIIRGGGLPEPAARLLAYSRRIVQNIPDVAGFAVVGWNKEGQYSFGCGADDTAIPLTMLPTWLAEVARREMVTTQQIHDVLEREYGVEPPRPPIA